MPGFIEPLLAPRSVALIGASDDPSKTAGRPLRFLRNAGFAGTIYPVNPRRATVLGEKAWPSLDKLPEVPDHAYVLVPTESVVETVRDCAKAGIKVATILASGFAEAGDVGVSRENHLREIAAETGIRIVGPSSLGVVNLRNSLLLTANAAFAEADLPKGDVLVASHSGTMIGALVSRGKARGIGFGALVSLGNEVDLGVGELCAATLDDPSIGGYLLFLETIRKADALRTFALEAARRGKPVLAYKLGRSSAGAELALSHTGALAGEDDVAEAFFRDCGIARVQTLEGLLEALPLVKKLPPGKRNARVAVVTTTGGGAAMVVDQLGVRGIEKTKLIDLTLTGARYDVMKGALDGLLASSEWDMVVAVVGSSARFNPELAVQPIVDSSGAAKPLAAFLVPEAPDALLKLARAGVPAFRTPEACADAVAAAFSRHLRKNISIWEPPGSTRMLDELQSYEILARAGIPHAPTVIYEKGKALPFPYPVVAKMLSSEIAHKSDVGGVALGIPDENALKQAIRRLPGEKHIVQHQVSGVGEVLLGYRIDAQVGPVVMLASGGLLTEIYRDRSVRLAPVDLETAREMIGELKAARALNGYRGKEPGDLEALASAIVAISKLSENNEVTEAEINPLIVRRAGEGVVAVDALVRLRAPGG